MIHVVFQSADVDVLKKAQELDEHLEGEVLEIKDDYAVGPLTNLDSAEGWQARRDWWKMLLEASAEYDPEETLSMVDDKMTIHQLTKILKEDEREVVWIWAAQNKHDVSGYYWLVSQLAPFQGRVFILYLNNLPFISEKGTIFYPNNLSDIQPREFLKAKKLSRPVTPSEFELDPDEWKRICNEGKMVRGLEGGKKLSQAGEDYYDAAITKYITGDFQRGNRVLQQYYSKEKDVTGDVFVLWRIKRLAAENGWEIRGDISKGSKDFELKNPLLPAGKKKADAEAEA